MKAQFLSLKAFFLLSTGEEHFVEWYILRFSGMEGVEVFRSPCSIAENNPLPCEPKSHAARRRRMEIQKFKVIATSSIRKPTETPQKRIKFTILGRDFARDCAKCPGMGSGRIQPQMRPRRLEMNKRQVFRLFR